MAALSGATVVVEAGARSGPLRVATEAHRLGRGVGAVPGPVTRVNGIGPHEPVRTGIRRFVTSATDVEELVSHPGGAGARLWPLSSTVVKHRERRRRRVPCRPLSRSVGIACWTNVRPTSLRVSAVRLKVHVAGRPAVLAGAVHRPRLDGQPRWALLRRGPVDLLRGRLRSRAEWH